MPLADATIVDASTTVSALNIAKTAGSIPALAGYLVNGFWQFNGEIAHHRGSATITYNISALSR
ncbi:MAG TPA: hypothetical protein VIQ05_20185 [Tardiphaga sp.]